jgi:chromosome segregation ATPase
MSSPEELRLRYLWVFLGIFLGFCTVTVLHFCLQRGKKRFELEEDLENREKDIDAAKLRIQALNQQHDADELEKQTQAATIAANQATIQEQRDKLTRLTPLQSEVDDLRPRYQRSQADLQDRDSTISRLTPLAREADNLRPKVSGLRDVVKEKDREIKDTKKELSEIRRKQRVLAERFEYAQQRLAEQNDTIRALKMEGQGDEDFLSAADDEEI